MSIESNFRRKISSFFKKYKNIIIIALIAWAVIFVVNLLLKNRQPIVVPKTTYTPHESVMEKDEVPKKVQGTVNTVLDEFMNYCNNKEYEKAYNMIDEDCKKEIYSNIEMFKKHIDQVFGNSKKLYNIQNYSNVGKVYVYNVKILEDVMATGTTGGYSYYEEKFVFKDTSQGVKLALGGFITKETPNIMAEDDNMKIVVAEKIIKYETELYKVKITNKTDNTIVLYDETVTNEIQLDISDQKRALENYESSAIVIYPGQTKEIPLEFTKFYDDGKTSQKLIFNSIRILPKYSGNINNNEEEMKNAVKLYSLNISLV